MTGDELREFRRSWGLELERLVVCGVRECEVLGVEAEAGEFAGGALLVAEDWVADELAVDAELVGATGYGFEFDEGRVGAAFEDAVAGFGGLAVFVDAPLFLVGVAADGGGDGAFVLFNDAFDEGDVEFFYLFAHE